MSSNNSKGKKRDPSLHAAHRQRMKSNFRENGLNGFHEHNVLEMLLFYAIPRCDTNEIAHRLINEFGSLYSVFDADIAELQQVDGIGLEAATLIKFIPEVFKAYELSKNAERPYIIDSESAAQYLSGYFKGATTETLVALFLDSRGYAIRHIEVSQYSVDEVSADLTVIVKLAVVQNAKGVVIAHNHTNGFALPSKSDIEFTEKLAKQCKQFDISVCEHIIFANNDICYLSKVKGIKKGTLLF